MEKFVVAGNKVKVGEFTFDGPFAEIHGSFPAHINGKKIFVLVASMKMNDLSLDAENPRIAADSVKITANGNLASKAGQERIAKYLLGELEDVDSLQLQKAAKTLEASIDYHGGQNEAVWVHNKKVFEGNRRFSILKRKKEEQIICQVYPDQLTNEDIYAITSQKHLQGPMEWSSFAKAQQAWKAKNEFMWEMDKIVSALGFSSAKSAEKYIGSYVWFMESKLEDIREWSKFHHAFVPTLTAHFGYCAKSEKFLPQGRRKFGDQLEPTEVDRVAGTKTDFSWFVDLIKNGHVTDCRQCDSVVAPIIRDADKDYGKKLFDILQTPPVVKEKKKTIPSAELAGTALKNFRNNSGMSTKVTDLADDFREICKSATRKAPYKESNADNHTLRLEIDSLVLELEKFKSILPKA